VTHDPRNGGHKALEGRSISAHGRWYQTLTIVEMLLRDARESLIDGANEVLAVARFRALRKTGGAG